MKVLNAIGFLIFFCSPNVSYCHNQQASAVEEKIIRTSDGVDLLVRIKGNGPACLFVHGGPGTGSHWVEKISDGLLERHFRMIYLDQRGADRSSSPIDSNYSMARMIEDFEEVRRELGIERWLTMGHSFGGILQAGYAVAHPEVQQGMIMLNCTLNLKESLNESWMPKAREILGVDDVEICSDDRIVIMERLNKLLKELLAQGIFWKMTYNSPENEQTVNATSGDIVNRNKDAQKAVLEVSDYWDDFKHFTMEIDVPVLFFYGKSDWMAGPLHYQGVKFPQMLLWESRVGHIALLENRPDLEKALVTFLKKYKF